MFVLENVEKYWLPEIREESQNPFVLVATKIDLRSEETTETRVTIRSSYKMGLVSYRRTRIINTPVWHENL
jgi:GTPase SAR1 family protein